MRWALKHGHSRGTLSSLLFPRRSPRIHDSRKHIITANAPCDSRIDAQWLDGQRHPDNEALIPRLLIWRHALNYGKLILSWRNDRSFLANQWLKNLKSGKSRPIPRHCACCKVSHHRTRTQLYKHYWHGPCKTTLLKHPTIPLHKFKWIPTHTFHLIPRDSSL